VSERRWRYYTKPEVLCVASTVPNDKQNTKNNVLGQANNWPAEHVREHALAGASRSVVFRSSEQLAGESTGAHYHDWHQLLYACEGVMRVQTTHGVWVVPPSRAVWIPAATVHEVRPIRRISLRNIYLDPLVFEGMIDDCCVVDVPPLLRELVLRVCTLPQEYQEQGADSRLVRVLVDQLRAVEQAAFHLPRPQDTRLIQVCDALLDNPADSRTLTQWAETLACSSRTLARMFQSQTGQSFGQWRQQARLLAAMVMLAEGRAVVDVALSLGYDSQSAFIAMFRRATGTTPAQYFAHN